MANARTHSSSQIFEKWPANMTFEIQMCPFFIISYDFGAVCRFSIFLPNSFRIMVWGYTWASIALAAVMLDTLTMQNSRRLFLMYLQNVYVLSLVSINGFHGQWMMSAGHRFLSIALFTCRAMFINFVLPACLLGAFLKHLSWGDLSGLTRHIVFRRLSIWFRSAAFTGNQLNNSYRCFFNWSLSYYLILTRIL